MGSQEKMNGGSFANENIRSSILGYIENNPGISFKILMIAFKIPEGTLRFHLDKLIKAKKIVLEKKKNIRCYYSFLAVKFPHVRGNVKLTSDQERILYLILDQPGIKRQQIMEATRMDRKTINYNIKRLKTHNLIWKVKRGGIEGYEAITKDNLEGEMFKAIVKKFIDDDIDRDTFFKLLKEFE